MEGTEEEEKFCRSTTIRKRVSLREDEEEKEEKEEGGVDVNPEGRTYLSYGLLKLGGMESGFSCLPITQENHDLGKPLEDSVEEYREVTGTATEERTYGLDTEKIIYLVQKELRVSGGTRMSRVKTLLNLKGGDWNTLSLRWKRRFYETFLWLNQSPRERLGVEEEEDKISTRMPKVSRLIPVLISEMKKLRVSIQTLADKVLLEDYDSVRNMVASPLPWKYMSRFRRTQYLKIWEWLRMTSVGRLALLADSPNFFSLNVFHYEIGTPDIEALMAEILSFLLDKGITLQEISQTLNLDVRVSSEFLSHPVCLSKTSPEQRKVINSLVNWFRLAQPGVNGEPSIPNAPPEIIDLSANPIINLRVSVLEDDDCEVSFKEADPKKKKRRRRFSDKQAKILREIFEKNNRPTKVEKNQIAERLKVPVVSIASYFTSNRHRVMKRSISLNESSGRENTSPC